MTESRKRSRKSKLEVRKDDCEFEVVCDDTNNDYVQHLQLPEPTCPETSPKPAKIVYYPELPFIPDHDYCWPFTASRPIQHSNTYEPNIKLPRLSKTNTAIGITKTPLNIHGVKIEAEQYDIPKEDLKSGILEKMDVNSKKCKGQNDGKIRMCKYDPDILFKESKQIAETSDNFADKILDIEMRNLWGNVLYTPNEVPPYEKKIQVAISVWQSWYNTSRSVREAPLFYQCHICELAWWRLQPFRDHIQNHDSAKLIVSLKEHLHESFIIASYEIVNKLLYIPIDGDCYRCGEDVNYHKVNCLSYSCSRCTKSVYTCSALRDHEAVCLYVNLVIYNISIDRQCTLCNHVINSVSLVNKHMIEAHSVRSDIPVHNVYKTCSGCGEKYFTFTLHNCSKSGRNCSCEHCCRKFASTKLAVNHITGARNRPMWCKICNKQLNYKCQEMEHLVEKHKSSYTMVYQCTICMDQNLLFLDEKSVNMHRLLRHQKKADKRRLFFEKMLVPKSCLREECTEEVVLKTGSKKASQKKKENKKVDPSLPSKSIAVLTADVKVTVDEINVKHEPMDEDENEEVDYEEMLLQMFNECPKTEAKAKVKSANNNTAEDNKTNNKPVDAFNNDHVYKTEVATEFDFSSVKVKAEPIDDIDITENPVDEVQIKAEPIDPSEIDSEMMEECYDYGEASIKIERNYEPEDFSIDAPSSSEDITSSDPATSKDTNSKDTNSKDTNSKDTSSKDTSSKDTSSKDATTSKDISSKVATVSKYVTSSPVDSDTEDELIIKEEFDDTITFKTENLTSFEPIQEIITDIEMLRDDKKRKKFKYEYSIEVIDSKGRLRQRKMYTCRKCGYTAHHKKYRKHMDTKCLVSPGINCSYPCSLCGLTFVLFKNYVLHFEKHGYDLMSCFICGETFKVEFKFLSHMHKHIKGSFVGVHLLDKSGEEIKRSQKRVTCMNCKKTVDQDTMFSHWETKHLKLKEINSDDEEPKLVIKEEPAPELTVDCERVTMNNKELEPAMLKLATDHLQVDSSEKECIICYRVFARRYDLKRHIVEHLLMDAHMKKIKYKDFRCQICSEGFYHQDRYKFHMRGHGNMPIFMCELCNKTFSDSSNFAKHKKTHNVRCLVCDICKKKFHSKLALEKHIGVRECAEHYTKPPLVCMFCPKTFHSRTTFKKHKYQVHQRPRYKCILCDMVFATVQNKWDHNWEVHQERKNVADCPICLKSFRKFADVRVHARAEHNADVNTIKKARKKDPQLFKVQDLKLQEKETIVVRE